MSERSSSLSGTLNSTRAQPGQGDRRPMDTKTVIKQVALSLLARRKKWIAVTTLVTLALLAPTAYLLSKEPPRYRTTATILIEDKAGREPFLRAQISAVRPRVIVAPVRLGGVTMAAQVSDGFAW